MGDEGGEGGCLPSNQTSLVALHWVAIDCIGVSQLHCRMFPLALGLQWQGKCQRGEAKLQTRLPLRQILSGESPWVNDSVKHISFMNGAFSIAQKIIFLGRGEDI